MKCPYCAEEIQPDAKKCKHCGEWQGWKEVGAEGSNTNYSCGELAVKGCGYSILVIIVVGLLSAIISTGVGASDAASHAIEQILCFFGIAGVVAYLVYL